MPSYVHAAFALVAASFILAAVLPAPRMPPARAGLLCLWLMGAGSVIFLVAVAMIVLAMVTTVPAPLVVAPALAVLGVALALWLTMFWLASSRSPDAAAADEGSDGEDGDGGGGGGGLGPEDDQPRDPGPPHGIRWDRFDREREAWESLREPVPVADRELAEA